MDAHVRLKSNGGYWQAFWISNGRPKAKSLGSKGKFSRRQALAKCRQLELDLKTGRGRDRGAPRLSEWVKEYLNIRTDLGQKSRVLADHTGRYLLAYFDNDPPIDEVSRADAAGWRAALSRGELRGANKYPKSDADATQNTRWHGYRKDISPTTTARPLSEFTVAKHVACAKKMFSAATEEDGVGYIDKNPFRKLSGRGPKSTKRWAQITRSDLDRILVACPSNGWRAAFALCRLAGLRRGEALDLRWGDLDWSDNRMSVSAHIVKQTTKKRTRIVPIDPARLPTGLTELLRGYFESAGEGRVCEGVSPHNLDRNAKAIIARAGVVVYGKPFHTLRKNRATEIAGEYPLHVLAEWLGHDVSVAAEFYLRVDESMYAAPKVAQPEAQSTESKSQK